MPKVQARREYVPVLIFIAICTLVGIFVLGDYGESWDEALNRRYGQHSLNNYGLLFQGKPPVKFWDGNLDYKGPAFFMGAALFSEFTRRLVPTLSNIESWHLAYFLTFEISVFCMYLLARRFLSQWAAFGAVVLYGSQPLLWGHAFINPKDTPFLAFFLISVALGTTLVSRAAAFEALNPSHEQQSIGVKTRWDRLEYHTRRRIAVAWVVMAASAVLIVLFKDAIHAVIGDLVSAVYAARPESIIGRIFTRVASQSAQIPPAAYIHKAQVLFQRFFWGLWGIVLMAASWWTFRNVTAASDWKMGQIGRYLLSVLKCPVCVLAGISLGLTVSIRILGPYAFILVGIYAVFILRERAPFLLAPYFLIAAVTTYITWPFLWTNPLTKLFDSLLKMSDYPWEGDLLFSGQLYFSNDLPWFYIPKLMLFQLTEPVVLFFLPGVALSIRQLIKKGKPELLVVLLLWFVIPTVGIIAVSDNLYDNFRHILFLLPPVFLASGVVLDWLFEKIKPVGWRAAILGLVMLPSLYGLVALHPYQYVYYNAFTGGNAGAFRKYEMDYWLTSFRELGLYLNQHAEPGSQIMVFGSSYLLRSVLRDDIYILASGQETPPDYAVVPARKNDDLLGCRRAPVIYKVERAGAVLGVIKAPEEAGQCP